MNISKDSLTYNINQITNIMKNKFLIYQCIKMYIITIMVNCFNCKVKIDSKKVKRSMLSFFNYKQWNYEITITKVEVFKHKNHLEILIETHRPGILIGKAGNTIDALINWLKDDLKTEVKINLKESKLWCVYR